MRSADPTRKKIKTRSFLLTNTFLVLIGICLAAVSIFLWKSQEARSLTQLEINIASNARSYASEAQTRFQGIYNALDRMSKREALRKARDLNEWQKDSSFLINTFQGIKGIAWVDSSFVIQQMVPTPGEGTLIGTKASDLPKAPSEINIWIPINDGENLKGFILGTIDVSEFILSVIEDIQNDYMLRVSQDEKIIFNTANWSEMKERFIVDRVVTLQNAGTVTLSLAATEDLIHFQTGNARKTFIFSLLFSLAILVAIFFAQKYKSISKVSELRFQKTLEGMLEGCQIIGFDWRYIFVNDTATVQFHKTREEMLGFTLMECFNAIEISDLFQQLKTSMEKRIPQELIHYFIFPDFSTAWYQLSIVPAPDGIFILSNDVTAQEQQKVEILAAQAELERLFSQAEQARRALLSVVEDQKLAEEQIRRLNDELEDRVLERTAQLEKTNAELEAFAYTVSHDLRAPLRAIDGFSRIIEEDYAHELDAEGRRLLGVVRNNAEKMDHLITDLLALARIGRAELNYTSINMAAMAKTIYQDLAVPAVLDKFELRISDLPPMAGDPTLMRQVWTNLISNAIKYSMPRETGVIEIDGSKNDGYCTYSIRDNGVGFDQAYANKLFGLFQQLHRPGEFEGTGVGLAIVQRIVQRHGGTIKGEGRLNAGATFTFMLPEKEANDG